MVGRLSREKRQNFCECMFMDVTSLLLGRWRPSFEEEPGRLRKHYGRKPTTLTILTTPSLTIRVFVSELRQLYNTLCYDTKLNILESIVSIITIYYVIGTLS